jgi:predicted metal-dependent peptidase
MRPFFTEIQKEQERASGQPIAVYFTDGYGDFPTTTPEAEVLWVVTNQGLGSGSFPFGTVIRLK